MRTESLAMSVHKAYRGSGARFASIEAVEQLAEELPDQFLMCRELPHAFMPFNATMDQHGVIERTLRCVRCQTRRVMGVNSKTGEMLYSKYEYPDGYLLKGFGRISGPARDVLRRASMGKTLAVLKAV